MRFDLRKSSISYGAQYCMIYLVVLFSVTCALTIYRSFLVPYIHDVDLASIDFSSLPWLWIFCLAMPITTLICLRKRYVDHSLLITLSLVFLIGLILYRKFLYGSVSYLYTTCDGFSQYLPTYTNFAHTLRETGSLPAWTSTIGFGSMQSYDVLLYPLNMITVLVGALFGDYALEMSFAWLQVAKIVLSALFMFLFLKELGKSSFSCSVTSVLYAFCGIIIMRGNWIFLADECYIALFILWSVELYLKKGKWHYIPISVFILAICLGIYYLYLYALLLFVYATVRYIHKGLPARQYFGFILKCGLLYLVGILLWGVILIGFSWSLFSTQRYAATTNYIELSGIFKTVEKNVLLSAVLRLFSTDIMGVFDQYTGHMNYLEGPLLYCGISCLFLAPQAFFASNKRQKYLIIIGLVAVLSYIIFPFVTDILNAFIKNEEASMRSYRMSSLWICILLLIVSAHGLDTNIKKGRFNFNVLAITSISVISLFLYLFLACLNYEIKIEDNVYRNVLLFLIAWMICFTVFRSDNRSSRTFIWILVILEVCIFSNTTIERSFSVAMDNYTNMYKDTLGYYGGVPEAVSYIETLDDGLFRTAGSNVSAGVSTYSSPQYFGIFSSKYYTNTDTSTFSFLNDVYPEAFGTSSSLKYSLGVEDNLVLSTLTSYKYRIVVSKSTENIQFGYDFLTTIGNMDVYKNRNALSIGFAYEKYIPTKRFLDLDYSERQICLLVCAVLEDGAETNLEEISKEELNSILEFSHNKTGDMSWYEDLTSNLSKEQLEVIDWTEDHIKGTINVKGDKILYFSIANIDGWTVWVDGKKTDIQSVNIGFFGVPLTSGEHTIELRFQSKSFFPGLIVSSVTLLLFICAICFRKKLLWLNKEPPLCCKYDIFPPKITRD